MTVYAIAVLCVVALAVGQILFKVSAAALSASSSLFSPKAATALVAAMCLYGITSVAWVWILQKVELGRVYPLMALAFVLVPIGSHLVFGERFQAQYFIGVALIMLGIIIAVRA
ncbi:MAG: 4-amino-4-deoxy-L-arabinose-phospho-UDP flippase [Candidatus Accumulibacter phosphatis]|jgi:drug/metabolite transporter (DMT)-like permease|uniref:4-amino-4-deoxy-L-arabinose-phospho-UDP flippase n=1 Tax=Candidatus Accumulibacter contiguus TaxID=2954381 RepID=A0ABX1T8X4_9PROT|nr:4-amino-4-deoxy-L-arabinose-phospho-UDP flippase [Candidatus Accumulibacter contiguus]NMQ06100.1 4-amino-4-deoxy-L-arabinose-phospho-UDP flippase [Candidatus Accumulibacter contiguus]